MVKLHANSLCCVLRASGYWRLRIDGKENSADPAVVWDCAGWNGTPQRHPGHKRPAEHTHQQERQNEGNTADTYGLFMCTQCIWCEYQLCIDSLFLSVRVCRRTCWLLWIRAAGCWRASMSRWCETPITTWTRTSLRIWPLCRGKNHLSWWGCRLATDRKSTSVLTWRHQKDESGTVFPSLTHLVWTFLPSNHYTSASITLWMIKTMWKDNTLFSLELYIVNYFSFVTLKIVGLKYIYLLIVTHLISAF